MRPSPGEADPAGPPAKAGDRNAENDFRWLVALRGTGSDHDDAVRRLYELLSHAARFEVARRRSALPHLGQGALDEIALEAAGDAAMAVLRRLDDFRGASRFTTWVYKFALLEAAAKVRRQSWRSREIQLEPDAWLLLTSERWTPELEAEYRDLLACLRYGVETVLTPHQRTVFGALALHGVPIDVLAERLSMSRGALYKTLHDARRKLKDHLLAAGHEVGGRSQERDAE